MPINSVASLAHSVSSFVYTASLCVFQDHGPAIAVKVKVSSASNWVEVVLFNIEESRRLPSFVKRILIEHLLTVQALVNVTISINEAASLVLLLFLLISEVVAALFLFSFTFFNIILRLNLF